MGETAAALIRRRPLLLLCLLCLIAWLPGFFTLPPLDRDESRFAQASKQMVESHNVIDIRFGREPRYKKPVGIYWLQAASTEVASVATGDHSYDHIWTYRIPSLLGGLAAALLAFWCARAFLGVEASFLSALLLGLTLLLSSEAKIAKTDAVLLATVLGAQGVLLRAYLARDPANPQPSFKLAMLGWASFAFGILIKGPVIAGVCGFTAAVLALWDREWRWMGKLRPLWGIPFTLLIVLPWLIAIAFASHGAFYSQSLGHDFADKLLNGEESHGEPPGFYLLITVATFWPATLFLIPALVATIVRHREPAARFLLAWAGGWWLIEFVPTKLPNYILPAYPALAMMAAAFALAPKEEGLPLWRRRLSLWSALYFLLGAGLLIALAILAPHFYGTGIAWDLMAMGAVPALLALIAAILMLRGRMGAAAGFAAVSAMTLYAVLTFVTAPRLDQFTVSQREAAMIASHRAPGDPAPVLAGYTEPSAMFLIGTDTRLAANGRDAAEMSASQGGLAAIEDGQRSGFQAHLAELEADAKPIDELSGFNYSRGRPVHITLFRVTPAHESGARPPE